MKKLVANFNPRELAVPAGPVNAQELDSWMAYGQSVGADASWYIQMFGARPNFLTEYVPFMLLDGRISLGMRVIKGRIQSKNLIRVRTENSDLGDYVTRYFDRIWQTTILDDLLTFLDYGFCGVEGEFEQNTQGWILPKDSHLYNPFYLRAATTEDNCFVGMFPNPGDDSRYIGFPKLWWLTHNKRRHPIYGDSHLREAFDPFWEKWNKHGFMEGRRVWFQRCAFFGPMLKYPPHGTVTIDAEGNQMSAMQYASIVLNRLYTGASIAFPNEKDDDGKDLWEMIASASNDVPTSYKEYGDQLRIEQWEAMGIISSLMETTANTYDDEGTNDLRQETMDSMITCIYKEIAVGCRSSNLEAAVTKIFGPNEEWDLYIEDWNKVSADVVGENAKNQGAVDAVQGGQDPALTVNPTGELPPPRGDEQGAAA